MINAYEEKYNTRNPLMIIKALGYHNDINFNEPIKMTGQKYSWQKVQNQIEKMIRNPEKRTTF